MAQKVAAGSFNDLHSAFVTTEDGMSLSELLQVLGCISITPILVPLLIPWIANPRFAKQIAYDKNLFFLIKAILEYPILAVLPIWIITILSGQKDDLSSIKGSGVLLIILFCVAVGILVVNHSVTAPKWLGFSEHWKKLKNLPTGWSSVADNRDDNLNSTRSSGSRLLFVTNYRAIVIYITVLCILAVDFPIFPRRFAKTKTYGISLMDVGTGCFVFANGIVSPEARGKRSPLKNSVKSTIPLLALGFVRLITVKGIEYQEVVEEYGVHWNFFFTLAGVKILSSLFFMFFDSTHGLKLSAGTCMLYEVLLNYNDCQNAYIMNPQVSRDGLINANREGVFSVLGYLAIYMSSVYFGKLIYWKSRITIQDWLKYALQTSLQIAVLWGLYATATTYGNPPCRRTANMGYILLMVALNYSLLWFQMFLALMQVCIQHVGLIYGPMVFYELAALQRKETDRLHNLQQMAKGFACESQEDEDDDEGVDEQLEYLEKQLEEAFKEAKYQTGSFSAENGLFQKIVFIENEITRLEGKLTKDASSQNNSSSADESSGRNLVVMPDLSKSPVLLEAICFNGLAVFLLGNLLTGLINCTIYTMYTTDILSLCYLWFYTTVISAFSVSMYWYKFQLKFW